MAKTLHFIAYDNETVLLDSENEFEAQCAMTEHVNKLIGDNYNTRILFLGLGDFIMLCVGENDYHTVKVSVEIR